MMFKALNKNLLYLHVGENKKSEKIKTSHLLFIHFPLLFFLPKIFGGIPPHPPFFLVKKYYRIKTKVNIRRQCVLKIHKVLPKKKDLKMEGMLRRSTRQNHAAIVQHTFICGCCQVEGEKMLQNSLLLKCCNNFVHRRCMKEWETRREYEDTRPTCPYCREPVTPMKNPLPWIGPAVEDSDDGTADAIAAVANEDAVLESDEMVVDSDDEPERAPAIVQNDEATSSALVNRPVMTREQIVARLRELLGSPELESRLREVSRFVPLLSLHLRDLLETLMLNNGIYVINLIVDCEDDERLYNFRFHFQRLIERIAKELSALLKQPSHSFYMERKKTLWKHLKQLATKEYSICASIKIPTSYEERLLERYWTIQTTNSILPKNFITTFSTNEFFHDNLD